MINSFKVSIIKNNSVEDCYNLYKEEHDCNCEECPINEDTFKCDTCNKRYYDPCPYFSYDIYSSEHFIIKKFIEAKYNVTINNLSRIICSEKCMDNDSKLIKKYITEENIKEFIKKHEETYYARYQIFLNFLYEYNIQYKDYISIKKKTNSDLEQYLNFANKKAKQDLFKTILDNCRVLNERSDIPVSDFFCSKCRTPFNGTPYKETPIVLCSKACEKEFDLF